MTHITNIEIEEMADSILSGIDYQLQSEENGYIADWRKNEVRESIIYSIRSFVDNQ